MDNNNTGNSQQLDNTTTTTTGQQLMDNNSNGQGQEIVNTTAVMDQYLVVATAFNYDEDEKITFNAEVSSPAWEPIDWRAMAALMLTHVNQRPDADFEYTDVVILNLIKVGYTRKENN